MKRLTVKHTKAVLMEAYIRIDSCSGIVLWFSVGSKTYYTTDVSGGNAQALGKNLARAVRQYNKALDKVENAK